MAYRSAARFAVRHAYAVIGIWLLLAASGAFFAARLPSVLGDHGLITDGPYAQAQQVLARSFGVPDEPVVLLFDNPAGGLEPDFRAYIERTLRAVDRVSGVDVAASPFSRPGMARGEYAYALLSVPGSVPLKRQAIADIRRATGGLSPFTVTLTGKPVVQEAVNRSSGQDLRAAESVGIPLAFLLLVWTFGGIWAAMIPILTGVMAVAIAMGLLYGVGAGTGVPLSVFAYNVIPMVGMALCVDFALFLVSRFREERERLPAEEAVYRAAETSGRIVAVSAACILLALIGTLAIRMPMFQSVALGAMLVVVVSVALNLTFVPALLAVLNRRIPRMRQPRESRGRRGFLSGWISEVLKRPAAAALLSAMALAACAFPIQDMRLAVPGPESLPAGQEARAAAAVIADNFRIPSLSLAYLLIDEAVREAGAGDGRPLEERIAAALKEDPLVLRFFSDRSLGGGHIRRITVWLRAEETSSEAMAWVRSAQRNLPPGVLVGGEPKYHQEVMDEIGGSLPDVLRFVVLSNFVVLAAAFRSLLLPLKAIAMNLVSLAASLGILTWMFQDGRFGLEPTKIAIMIPVFLFGLTFGISMDYGVFLLSRIYESYRRSRDHELAIRDGLTASGRVITSAAAIMIAVTAPFSLAGVSGVKQLGIGIAAALLLDATLVRMVLVPSLMKLMGRWNWWLPLAKR